MAAPSGSNAVRILVTIFSRDRIKSYPGGAQLYECEIVGPKRMGVYAAGACSKLPDGDFALELFHHTNDSGFAGISASKGIWSSPWSLQGVRKLTSVAHVYFTSLPTLRNADDFARIAMSDAGKLYFQTTSDRTVEDVLGLTVYRESTTGRTHAIKVKVASALLAPPHLYFHPATSTQPAYYEVIGPEIFRIGVHPKSVVSCKYGIAQLKAGDRKDFNYVVLGHADTPEGLVAPYDEESTGEVMFLEDLRSDLDLFKFWRANANTDLVTGRNREAR